MSPFEITLFGVGLVTGLTHYFRNRERRDPEYPLVSAQPVPRSDPEYLKHRRIRYAYRLAFQDDVGEVIGMYQDGTPIRRPG